MSIQHPFTDKINLEKENKTVGGNKLKNIIKTKTTIRNQNTVQREEKNQNKKKLNNICMSESNLRVENALRKHEAMIRRILIYSTSVSPGVHQTVGRPL